MTTEKSLALAESAFFNERVSLSMAYVDITGDLVAGVMLSQILYWFTPDKNGHTKLRIQKDGEFWIAKTWQEWCDELRISRRECARALKILCGLEIIQKERFRFNGSPTTHIRVNWDNFNRLIEDWKTNRAELYRSQEDDENTVKIPFCAKRANGNVQNAQMEMHETRKTLTDTTTDITSDTTVIGCEDNKKEKHHSSSLDDPIIPITQNDIHDAYLKQENEGYNSEEQASTNVKTYDRNDRVSFSGENGDNSILDLEDDNPIVRNAYHNDYYDYYMNSSDNVIDLDIVHKQVQNALYELGGEDNDKHHYDTISYIFDYYYYAYKVAIGHEHTRLKTDSVIEIIDTMLSNQDDYLLDVSVYQQYICDYFHQTFNGNEYGECDYSMAHFITTLYYRNLNTERKSYDPRTLKDEYGYAPYE